MAPYMFHFTKDGEYVDGVVVSDKQGADTEFRQKLANTYEGCHTWVFDGPWYSMPAAGLNYARWSPEATSTVPECVRVAEFVRDKP